MRFILADDVARMLGIPRARVYRMAQRREIPCVRFGRSIRFDAEKIKGWLERGGGRASVKVMADIAQA